MIKIASNISNRLANKPKLLFLIDALGAMTTAFLLFVVSRKFNEQFGLSKEILTLLSATAVCLCVYSTACFLLLKGYWSSFIRGISTANLLYCTLTIGVLAIYYPQLTIIGIAYFLVEVAIICGLVFIELNVAKVINK